MMFKRKSTKHAQRARAIDSDAASGEATSDTAAGTGDESPSILATKLKNKLKSRNKPKSKLSFGGEDVRSRIPRLGYVLMACVFAGR